MSGNTTSSSPARVPTSITLDAHTLRLEWDGGQSLLQADFLRTHCRCSQCRQAALRGTAVNAVSAVLPVTLVDASPVGSYGVQLHFSDGHDRGIYPWEYLHALAHPAVPLG